MLGVSLRLPEAADLGGALSKYIAANYTPEEHQQSAKAIADVQALRKRMVQSVTDQSHSATLAAFTSYYKVLACVTARFPFQSASGSSTAPLAPAAAASKESTLSKIFSKQKVTQVSLTTTWFDAFRHSNRVSDIDLAFEKYSVVFNIASLLSRQATQIKSAASPPGSAYALPATTASGDNLKEACRLFQTSSGLFDHLARTSEIVGGTLGNGMSLDLNPEALSMLSVLMLAQAQACFFEKSTTTASPRLVAKLAMGVSALFQQAYLRCEKHPKLTALKNKADVYPWGTHCAYQMLCYQAASHYWQAKGILAEETEYGLEIAHLERARAILQQARSSEVGLLRNLSDNRTKLEQAIQARLVVAAKDNETIYYCAIPRADSVPHPDALTPVKTLPYLDAPDGLTIDPAKDDPFKDLISPHLRAQHDVVRGKITEAQSQLARKVTDSEQVVKASLESLGLPASLDALTDGGAGLPDDVWQRVQETQFKGGVAQLRELSCRIDSAVEESQSAFDAARAQLTKEAESDQAMRKQFAHRWNRRPSEQLTVNFQRDVESIKRFLHDADASNTKVRAELDACATKFDLLALSQSELDERLPRATAEQSTASQQSVATLRQQLSEIAENTNSMKQLITEFEAKATSTDIMGSLLAAVHAPSSVDGVVSSTGASGDVVARELAPFASFDARFVELEATQNTLVQEVTKANELFLSLRTADDSTQRRQVFLQQVNSSVASFTKLLANFNEGLKFYSDLVTQKIAPFAQKIADFVIARDMESKLILEQLTKEIANFKEEEKNANASVFPDASGAAAGGALGVTQSGYPSAAATHSAANPNLAYEPNSNLYSMEQAPDPTPAAAQQRSQAPPVPQRQPKPQQTPQPQAPPQPQVPPQQPPYSAAPAYSPNYAPQQPPQPQYNPYQQGPPPQQQNPYAHVPYGFQPPPSHYQQPPQPYQPQPYSQPYAPQPYAPQHYQQPPAPQRPPAQSSEWACAACTFLNPSSASACSMCATKRS